jgi:GntR family transcriptional regulator
MSDNMFVIDVMSRVPVYEQVINQVEQMVLTKVMKSGDRMPSVRGLSMQLAINPNTIQKAYTELERRGIIITVPGKGAFIADDAHEKASVLGKDKLSEYREIVDKLAIAGVSKQELIDIIEESYNKNNLRGE